VHATTEHRIGLRFPRSQARTLRHLADRAKHMELGPDAVELFTQAAKAARNSEPLIIVCTNPLEAVLTADGFTKYGVTRPAIDELNA
jgi:hypothetical protein